MRLGVDEGLPNRSGSRKGCQQVGRVKPQRVRCRARESALGADERRSFNFQELTLIVRPQAGAFEERLWRCSQQTSRTTQRSAYLGCQQPIAREEEEEEDEEEEERRTVRPIHPLSHSSKQSPDPATLASRPC